MDFLKMVNKAADELKEVAENVIDSADGLLGQMQTREPVGQKPDPVHKKVLSIVYDPKVPSEGGKRLSKVLKWNDPAELSAQYIEDLRECSYGYANYTVVDTIMVDGLPVKVDGFAYTPDGFLKCWREKKGFHDPDAVDYHRILRDHKIIPRINSGEIDEVWLWGFPYAGYYESIMAGPGAFWCNAPALKDTDEANRRFIIMGYNYQRIVRIGIVFYAKFYINIVIIFFPGAKDPVENIQVPAMIFVHIFEILRMVYLVLFVCIHKFLQESQFRHILRV